MVNYKPDILWFDGEWVLPSMEDIFMDEIGDMARKYNPYVIMVNREGGVEENYMTPEQGIPTYTLMDYWESCMCMGDQWAFKPNDNYKPVSQLLQWLMQITSLGGNLLLDVGPQPNGVFPPVAASRMLEMGDWLSVNGDAVYGTRPLFPYQFTDLHTTPSGANTTYYSYYLSSKANFVYITMWQPYDNFVFDPTLTIYFRHRLANNTLVDVDLLGAKQKITYSWVASQRVQLQNLPSQPPNPYAFVFKLTYQNKIVGA
jgi:alpha-L-fucosidase